MTPKVLDIWVYMSATPLLGLTVTLVWLYLEFLRLLAKARERK